MCAALLVAAAVVLLAPTAGSGSTAPAHSWRFAPTINAPWAHEGDDEDADTPQAAVGLCRSAPFNLTTAYAATSNIDAIVGDAVNNSGASNFGCITPQNETTIAVDPSNPRHLVAGANDYRVCCDFTGLNDSTAWAYTSFDGGLTWTNVQLPALTAETGGQGQFTKADSAGRPSRSGRTAPSTTRTSSLAGRAPRRASR